MPSRTKDTDDRQRRQYKQQELRTIGGSGRPARAWIGGSIVEDVARSVGAHEAAVGLDVVRETHVGYELQLIELLLGEERMFGG